MAREFPKDRDDHYLPQGYLRGFIDPTLPETDSQRLWVYNLAHRKWKKRSTAQIGYEQGFYDFVGRQGDRRHPDEIFTPLENEYPFLIAKLRKEGFHGWRDHVDFLLRYVQMIRCRSPLFREHFLNEWRDKRGARVIAIEGTNKVTVDSLKLRRFSPGALKEGSINNMLTEMDSGTSILKSYIWQLRLATVPEDCFVANDHPLLATVDNENLLFPLCWQACLVGRRNPFSIEFTGTSVRERALIRRMYFETATRFVVAPSPLTNIL